MGIQNGDLFSVETMLVAGIPTGQTTTQIILGSSIPTMNISIIAIGTSEQQLLITFSNYGVDNEPGLVINKDVEVQGAGVIVR